MVLKVPSRVMFRCGGALLERGWTRCAAASLKLAARLDPTDPVCWVETARAYSRLEDRDTAARCCERALELDPADKPANHLLRSLFLHGENYHTVLERFHRGLRPRTYVEIGIARGDTLRHVAPDTLAIGIDPEPRLSYAPPPNVRVFSETSDAFFARDDVRARLGHGAVDLAFIDGLHHFEATLSDFMHLERWCHTGSVVLLHDCVPRTRRTSMRERSMLLWTGDVWRALVLLKRHRPDLSIHTLATPPTGLGVVTNLDPSSSVIASRFEELVEEGLALDYSYLDSDRAGKLNLVDNDEDAPSRLIDARRRARVH